MVSDKKVFWSGKIIRENLSCVSEETISKESICKVCFSPLKSKNTNIDQYSNISNTCDKCLEEENNEE